ncbi:hypothetical protein AGOR_G00239190 [Albula goreensis]|uniref:Matrin-type domain-containing protein n=1 Tax=Albula goreensis TaxID=1534307 RepID=A0A8T3CIF3_9TELE|nr:hypothetical protein AGOR_G00239190 [Albula goreensis]
MDFQHRAGGKTGSGGVASSSESNRDRRERLRQLALETIDINKDPYFMKNHLGSYECKLCLTLHNNEGSYLAHTQGKKHQTNLARRAAKEAKEAPAQPAPEKVKVEVKKFVKIGRPGYKVTKQRILKQGNRVYSSRSITQRSQRALVHGTASCRHTSSALNHLTADGSIYSLLLSPMKQSPSRSPAERLTKARVGSGHIGTRRPNSSSCNSTLRWRKLCPQPAARCPRWV